MPLVLGVPSNDLTVNLARVGARLLSPSSCRTLFNGRVKEEPEPRLRSDTSASIAPFDDDGASLSHPSSNPFPCASLEASPSQPHAGVPDIRHAGGT